MFLFVACVKTTDERSIYARDLTLLEIGQLEPYAEITSSADDTDPAQRSMSYQVASVEQSVPVEFTPPVESATTVVRRAGSTEVSTESSSSHSSIPLYEERIATRKQRVKTGEVKISKRIVTDTIATETPIKREKITIEIESIYGGDTQIDFADAKVADDGSISMGIYEERTEVCRQVVPYQNVSVRKEVVEDVVKTQQNAQARRAVR